MKRFALTALILVLTMLAPVSALALEGEYTWRGHPVTLTQVEENPDWLSEWLPKDSGLEEYALVIHLTIEEVLWKDGALLDDMTLETSLRDSQGNAYAPLPWLKITGTEDPFVIYPFSIPKTVAVDDLTLALGGGAEESAQNAAQGGAVELTATDGSLIALTPLEAGSFQQQKDDVVVHTRIGTTVHNSGSQFKEGSGLQLSNMRNTKQYAMPMIAFHYKSDLDFDRTADELGGIGATAALTLDGTDYPVQVAWITEEMACYIFDCPALPEGTASFTVEGNALRIQP